MSAISRELQENGGDVGKAMEDILGKVEAIDAAQERQALSKEEAAQREARVMRLLSGVAALRKEHSGY